MTEESDYPTDTKCPEKLPWLKIQNCSFKREILKPQLRNLQILNLSNNNLTKVPLCFHNLPLVELNLSYNNLHSFSDELIASPLGDTLQILDLSSNRIVELSPYFFLMKEITDLSLNYNYLQKLPRNIHLMKSLTNLYASHNNLRVLPSGIRELELVTLDLSNNPLDTEINPKLLTLRQLPSLKAITAAAIIEYKILCTAEYLPKNLIDYIVEHSLCFCGRKVFQSVSLCTIMFDLKQIALLVKPINSTNPYKAPLETYFCSSQCSEQFLPIFT